MTKQARPVFVDAMTRIIAAELVNALAIPSEQAEVAAAEATHAFCREFGKQPVYVPAHIQYTLKPRDMDLWNKYQGHNIPELAREFNLTTVQVYQIIKRMRTLARTRTEPQLPGF